MRVIILGLGVQGQKRRGVAGKDVVAAVDPVHPEADYRDLDQVPPDSYDAALVCTPDAAKLPLLTVLLGSGKHVLVEKPLLADDNSELAALAALSRDRHAICYTAYNHRFEPHFAAMKSIVDSGELGKIYRVRLFYGNGTAREVRNSAWRDSGAGVLPDLGSHLLDTIEFWFGRPAAGFRVVSADRFENRAFDHVVLHSAGPPSIELEMTLLSWRNNFTCDVFAEHGSVHIESLCKWGPSRLTRRVRKLPSGRPDETATVLVQPDPTWAVEYDHFRGLCAKGGGNLDTDRWINATLAALSREALEMRP